MRKTFYVVKLGGNLYAGKGYSLTHNSTTDILLAARYYDLTSAEKACAKTIRGTIEEYVLQDSDSLNDELESLRAANSRLREERDDALARLSKYESTVTPK